MNMTSDDVLAELDGLKEVAAQCLRRTRLPSRRAGARRGRGALPDDLFRPLHE